jgi:hypothetical protein
VKSHRLISKFCHFPTLLAGLALLALLLLPAVAGAQTNGLISGTVTDKSGAAVVGANVSIVSTGGNLTRATVTNGDGVYVASALPPGTYNITITAKGFQKFEAKGVVLEVAQKARLDVALTVGAVTEEVLVSGENVAQVDTQSAEMGSTITGKQVQELELNGRNFTQLVTLVPGVISQSGQDEGTVGIAGNTMYSINGGRGQYNNWEIDGGDNMDNGSNNSINVYPNLEAIAEFKVLTSNYGAQYGKNGSGTIEVETKSGTREFHGSAFYYGRNDFFNANSWQDNGTGVPRPAYKKHDWGYTVGGPVYIPHLYNNDKKKTFFFWSQEWRREIVPGQNIAQAVPSSDEIKNGDFNDVCPVYTGASFDPNAFPACPYQSGKPGVPFANNTLPMPFSSTANALLSLIPAANNFTGIAGNYPSGQAAGTPIPVYVANPSLPTTWREELIRVDHNLTDNQRLTFRYIHDTWQTVNQGPLWGQYNNTFDNTNTNFAGPTTSFVARVTSNFSPSLLNEFVASYTDDHIFLSNVSNNINLPQGSIDLNPLFANGLGNKIPAFQVGNAPSCPPPPNINPNCNINGGAVYGSGGFNVDTGYFPWKNANPTYTYRDNVTKIIANHTLSFGAYFAAAQKNQSSSVDVQGQLSFAFTNPLSSNNPFADLLLGNIQQYTQNQAELFFYDRYKILEPYFQDDWRVTKKLTLNLGLRWSVFGRWQEKNDKEFGFSVAAYNPNAAPPLFPFNDPNSQLLNIGPGQSQFNGIIQCGQSKPTIAGISPGTTGCLQNKWVNPGPRLGFAYDPVGNGKWAIRGGYGIFFEHMNGNEANAELLQQSASPLAANGTVSNVVGGYPGVAGNLGPAGPPSPLTPFSIPDRIQWPYMQQWNLGVEHELPGNVLLSVAYVGSKGTHLTRQFDLNQLTPVPNSENPYVLDHLGAIAGPGANPINPQGDCNPMNSNFTFDSTGLPTSAQISGTLGTSIVTVTDPHVVQNLFVACNNAGVNNYYRKFQGYGSITRVEPSANSIYNSLQIGVRRSVGDLTLSASYTYSHSIDDSSDRSDALFVDPNNPSLSRGSSNFDIRHAFTLSYVYALPFFKAPGITHTLLGGWQVSGITTALSGPPFSLSTGSTAFPDNAGLANGIGGSVTAFPDLVANPNSVTAAQRAAYAGTFGVLNYNPDAFAQPVGLTVGNFGRNRLNLPGRLNFDFGLFKRFPIKEKYAFEFRWENFNVFNHTQLDAIGGSTSSSGTGAIAALDCYSCNSQVLLLNQSHNPRIMQFGLRFQF